MKPIDDAVASYVQRYTSPDERTVLDLVWVFEPDDFRELAGQRRARIYDNISEEIVLDLVKYDGGVRSYDWGDDGALSLAMENGAELRIWMAKGIYATSTDDWAVHPLTEIQAHAAAYLGISERAVDDQPDNATAPGLRKAGWLIVALMVIVGAAVSIESGHRHFRFVFIPHGLWRSH